MLIIGAPFGNYFQYDGALSTIGTFTWERRPGRFRRVIQTVRYYPSLKAWVNRIGLRNPGIRSVKNSDGKILSIHGFNLDDWKNLIEWCNGWTEPGELVELNVSCPNVTDDNHGTNLPLYAMAVSMLGADSVIAKVSPIGYLDEVRSAVSCGVKWVHLCNTLPTPKGGMSGKPLMAVSVQAVREVRRQFPELTITGGGGVTSERDIEAYLNAGADHVAIASMLFFPWNWSKPNRFIKHLQESFRAPLRDPGDMRHACTPSGIAG